MAITKTRELKSMRMLIEGGKSFIESEYVDVIIDDEMPKGQQRIEIRKINAAYRVDRDEAEVAKVLGDAQAALTSQVITMDATITKHEKIISDLTAELNAKK